VAVIDIRFAIEDARIYILLGQLKIFFLKIYFFFFRGRFFPPPKKKTDGKKGGGTTYALWISKETQ